MKKYFVGCLLMIIFLMHGNTVYCDAHTATVLPIQQMGNGVIKTFEPFVNQVKWAYKHGSVAMNQTMEAVIDWSNNFSDAYSNTMEFQSMSQQEKIGFAVGSVTTSIGLLYLIHAVKISNVFKIPLYAVVAPALVPAGMSVYDLVQQYYPAAAGYVSQQVQALLRKRQKS